MLDVIIIIWLISIIVLSLYTGYAFGKGSQNIVQDDAPLPQYSNKPGGIFKFKIDVPSGVVMRPTAQDIAKWNEDPKIKEEKEALAQTLSELPEIKKLKEQHEEFING